MAGPGATTSFISKCAPLQRTDYDSCASLTMCNLSPTTADELDSIYRDGTGAFRAMGSLLESDIMAKACQVVENPLYTMIRAYSKNWGTHVLNKSKRIKSGIWEVEPFITVGRKGPINNNYWMAFGGANTSGNGPVTGRAYTYMVKVSSKQGIPGDPAWFPPGLEVYISGVGGGGAATRTNWTVSDSAMSGTDVQLYLASRNTASNLPSYKLAYPTGGSEWGVLMRGVPVISPPESYCAQIPRVNTKYDFLSFIESTRWSICMDEETQKFRRYLSENNPLYKNYYEVEESEWNRQLLSDFQNRLVNTFLFQKASPNQTATGWKNLPTISSMSDNTTGDYFYMPGIEGRCLGRKATSEGIYEQLAACGRVKDAQGNALNWAELRQELYNINRVRRDNGDTSNTIEILMDSAYRPLFIAGLFKYMANQYTDANGVSLMRANLDIKQEKTNLGFIFQDFVLDYPAGVTLRIVSHPALDDLLTAHTNVSAGIAGAGRWILIFDWETMYMANINSQTVELETGNIKDLAKVNMDAFCRMEMPIRRIKHNGQSFTSVDDCPAASLWIENVAFAIPHWSGAVGDGSDMYGGSPGY